MTIKLDNYSQHNASNESPRSLVSTAGVKLTLKPISEPPIPKFTITNAFNDTAKVVILNNNEQTDESSDELPAQPPSNQPTRGDEKTSTRNDYAAHAITSTSSSCSGTNAEDNLSTCSSASSSSYSSSSSLTHPNDDIKLIIKV